MSAQRNDILDGLRLRRDYCEREWLKDSERSARSHDHYLEAERALARAQLRRLPAMAEPVNFYSIEEAS